MSHPYYHCLINVKRWGGKPDDYAKLNSWFDETKAILPDMRHRALRHHSEGIFMLERIFGETIINSDGRVVPVRKIGEEHCIADLGYIPAASDWLRAIRPEAWMYRRGAKQHYDKEGNLIQ